MKKLLLFLASMFIALGIYAQPNAWINEIHYDNDGADENEGVEVIIENASNYNLADFTVVLYNGNGGASYDSYTLDEFTEGTTVNGFTIYYKYISTGIQNGAPDGIALGYQGNLIQFLSYEGSFSATDGIANGQTSTDIGVSETGTTPSGQSLQLSGSGTQYSDFTWENPQTATFGDVNVNQTLGNSTPTKLAITDVTPNPQYANWEFDVTVQAQDDNGTPGNVSQNTTFNLNTDGSGTITLLSGTQEIPAGQNSVTVTVRYDVAETFNLTAEITGGDNLTTSAAYSVTIAPMPTQIVSETPDSLVFDKNPTETLHDYGIYVYTGEGSPWAVSNYNGDYFMKASNYVGGSSVPINTWAILPKFTGANNAIANFVSASYADLATTQTSFSVKISTDYPGYGDPSTANWTDLSFTLPTGGYDWVKSGDIDLSAYNGQEFYLAFVLSSDGTDNNTIEVDSLVIYNQSTTTGLQNIANEAEFTIYPNPVSSVLYINATGNLDIVDNAGRIVKHFEVKGNSTLDVADLQPGIYFARLTDNNSAVQVRKFIKR